MRNSQWHLLDARYETTCRKCKAPIAVGSSIWWQGESKAVRCATCIPLQVKRQLATMLPPASMPEYKRYTPNAT